MSNIIDLTRWRNGVSAPAQTEQSSQSEKTTQRSYELTMRSFDDGLQMGMVVSSNEVSRILRMLHNIERKKQKLRSSSNFTAAT